MIAEKVVKNLSSLLARERGTLARVDLYALCRAVNLTPYTLTLALEPGREIIDESGRCWRFRGSSRGKLVFTRELLLEEG